MDVSTEFAGGSGTVLSEDGLILTNYHVIAEVAENPKDGEDEPVVIGLTVDPHDPPRELFRGKVVAFNKDIDFALIQVDCGFYRQPLPKNYRFVTIPLGDPASLEIGDTIWAIGYPVLGGSNGRASITLTRGVLSGFEEKPIGTMLKTDANIGSGNSGGAAVDSNWRLIGVPSYHHVDPEDVSSMVVHPLARAAAESVAADDRPAGARRSGLNSPRWPRDGSGRLLQARIAFSNRPRPGHSSRRGGRQSLRSKIA